MPLPLPDFMKQLQWMMTEMLQLLTVHRQSARVKQVDAKLDERDEQQQVQGCHQMCPDQRCELAWSKDQSQKHPKQRRESHSRIDTNPHPQRQAPGQSSRRKAAAKRT